MKSEKSECPICKAFVRFTNHVKDGITIPIAFEFAVAQMMEEVISDTVDTVYSESFKDGYTAGLRRASALSEEFADAIEAEDEEDTECDCESCQIEQEYEKCDDCDCIDGQCEIDIAKQIRRAIWEDEMQ